MANRIFPKFKPKILSSQAGVPFHKFDSALEIPEGKDPKKNARLTLTLRLRVNFADSTNPVQGLIVKQDGQTFAVDDDHWMFPARDWTEEAKTRFREKFEKKAEKTWDNQFVLLTPRFYPSLDYVNYYGWRFRPNVICGFRLEITKLHPHHTINVARPVRQAAAVRKMGTTQTKNVAQFDDGTFRSNSTNYDDLDLYKPWTNQATQVAHNIVGHEIGHALGQGHIMQLLKMSVTKQTDEYGDPNTVEGWNIMGHGDRIYLINAITWQHRIALHCPGTKFFDWQPTGIMTTPPRSISPLSDVLIRNGVQAALPDF